MTTDIWMVIFILVATILAFVVDRFRMDFVAFVSLLALVLTGILTPVEATAGFSNPLVLMIAGLFVVGGAILETGVADQVGSTLGQIGGTSPVRLTMTVMLACALLSAFISSTGTVAVMLPIVLSLSRRAGISPSKLLIPLAFAAALGGMLTLIGTPSNMVVSQELRHAGLAPFRFFSFAPAGLLILGVGVGFMCTVGMRLLPDGSQGPSDTVRVIQEQRYVSRPDLIHSYGFEGQISEVTIPTGSAFAGRTLREIGLRTAFRVNVIAVLTHRSRGAAVRKCNADTLLQPGDTLFIKSSSEGAIEHLVLQGHVQFVEVPDSLPPEVYLAELIIPPRSELVGRTVREIDFFRQYEAMVVAMHDGSEPIGTRTSDTPLKPGSTLLIAADQGALDRLKKSRRDLLLVSMQTEQHGATLAPAAGWVVAILLGMLVAMSTGVIANVTAVLLAAALTVISGAFRGSSAYKNIHWESIVMIASIMPLATALEKTGVLAMVTDAIVGSPTLAHPTLLLLLLFSVTSVLSQAISNTATSVLLAPLALDVSVRLDLSPYPLLMAVALAASTSFSTPVASPINALVTGAGRYRFVDFLKVGVPLQLIILVVTIVIVPLLFPFAK